MHAHIHQLLSLRDGEPVDADVARHVEQCSTCAAEAARLHLAQRNLRSLPSMDPPPAAWSGIQSRLQEQPVPARIHWSLIAGLVGAAVLVVVVSVGAIDSRQRLEVAAKTVPAPPIAAAVTVPAVTPTVDQLVAQSRQLDDLLQDLPQRPSVERIAMAATLDSIEQRIQWLDVQLSFASTAELNERQAQRLWSERVDLMDSLVKVRYAEAGSLRF
jgi:hypothetical protein